MSLAGRFVWRELITPNPDVAVSFYSRLFGWTPRAVQMPMPYTMLHHDGLDEDVGGAMAPPMEGVPAHWLDYVTVASLEESRAAIVAAGGKLITDAMTVPGIGRFCVAEDPAGAVFAPFQSETPGATPDRRPPVGTFCWSALMVPALDAVLPFYQQVFGWTPEAMGPEMAAFNDGATARASAQVCPPEVPPHWLKYIAVDEVEPVLAAATGLGATVLHPPTELPGMGRFAILADPTGAAFALWKDLS